MKTLKYFIEKQRQKEILSRDQHWRALSKLSTNFSLIGGILSWKFPNTNLQNFLTLSGMGWFMPMSTKMKERPWEAFRSRKPNRFRKKKTNHQQILINQKLLILLTCLQWIDKESSCPKHWTQTSSSPWTGKVIRDTKEDIVKQNDFLHIDQTMLFRWEILRALFVWEVVILRLIWGEVVWILRWYLSAVLLSMIFCLILFSRRLFFWDCSIKITNSLRLRSSFFSQ